MYKIGRRRKSSFEALPESPEFLDDQENEPRQWAALYMQLVAGFWRHANLAVSRSSPRISAGTPKLASIRLPGAQNGQKSALVMRFRCNRGLRGSDNFSGRIFPPISGIQGPRRLRPSSPAFKTRNQLPENEAAGLDFG
jgi:hypothetical protein